MTWRVGFLGEDGRKNEQVNGPIAFSSEGMRVRYDGVGLRLVMGAVKQLLMNVDEGR